MRYDTIISASSIPEGREEYVRGERDSFEYWERGKERVVTRGH